MLIDTVKRLFNCLIFCLVQALVLNRISIFDCAMPLLTVYFIIMLPRHYPRWGALLWGFFLGLSVDMFANTPGVSAASMTLVGFLQPYMIELFLPREAEENIKSSAATLGWSNFLTLAFLLTLIYCLVFFTLETFSFFNVLYWLKCVVGSLLFTFVLIMILERLRKK